MHRSARIAGIVSLSALVFAMRDADAQAPLLYSDGAQASPAYNLPAAPALPAGCAAPTREQCADSTWYASDACAKDPAKAQAMKDYCTWVFQKAWSDTQADAHPTLFPGSAPNSANPVMAPGTRVDHGKSVPAVKMNRPTDKRRYGGTVPKGARNPAAPLKTLDWTPSRVTQGGGSYAAAQAAAILPQLGPVAQKLQPLRVRPATDAALRQAAAALGAALDQKPPYVSPGPSVSSCEEYAHKRWGEWSDFAVAAKKLGINYRQIYKLAMDPTSKYFINKEILRQTGSAEWIPYQSFLGRNYPNWLYSDPNYASQFMPGWNIGGRNGVTQPYWWVRGQINGSSQDADALPPNAFVVQSPMWLDDPKAITANGKALITAQEIQQVKAAVAARRVVATGTVKPVIAKNDRSPLGVHREMKMLFDSKYGNPLDDELADADKRTGTYQDLLAKANDIRAELVCLSAADPCFRCHPAPNPTASLPAGLGQLHDRITGAPVINPGTASALWQTGSLASRMHSLANLSQMGGVLNELYKGAAAAAPGAKQKAPPVLGQVRGAAPAPANTCEADLAAKRAPVEDAYYGVTQQLTRMLANELKYGDRGCLANPGADAGNLCDWSYAKFAALTTTMFDDKVEADFQMCQSTVAAAMAPLNPKPPGNSFAAILKNPPNQSLVFPCTQRRDFTGSAPDVNWFIKIHDTYEGRWCEAARQNESIKQQQAAILGDLKGIKWKPGEISDKTADLNVLGDRDSLGAYFDYSADWSMKRFGQPVGGDEMKSCQFQGDGGANVKTGIYFFGDDLELFSLTSHGTANDAPKVSMNARYFDIDSLSHKTLKDFKDRPVPAGTEYKVPLVQPPISLGGIEYGFWVQIGPVPLHIVFGAAATAGLDYNFSGAGGNNCADLKKPSGFKIRSEVEPWVKADAYADASVDVLIASAGVRLDLTLLRLGIPIGINVKSVGSNYEFKNGGRISIDMLAGRLSAYAKVGIGPLSASFDVTIFGWDGFHTDIPLFGMDKTLSDGVVRVAMAKSVDPGSVKCSCAPGFCCSNLTCPNKNDAVCLASTKVTQNEPHVCTFNKNDYQAIQTSAQSTTYTYCGWFVK